jgi:hypothetical protein
MLRLHQPSLPSVAVVGTSHHTSSSQVAASTAASLAAVVSNRAAAYCRHLFEGSDRRWIDSLIGKECFRINFGAC